MLKRLVPSRTSQLTRTGATFVCVRPCTRKVPVVPAVRCSPTHGIYRSISVLTPGTTVINHDKEVLERSQELFVRGIRLLTKMEDDSPQQLERTTASEVLADISAVRKTVSPRGTLSDFMKAKKDRDAKLKSQGSNNQGSVTDVVVDRSSDSAHSDTVRKEAEAVLLVTAAADMGHPEAICFLGNRALTRSMDVACLESVPSKVKLAQKAKELYERASLLGCAEASYNLGVLLHDGLIVEPAQLVEGGDEDGSETKVVTTSSPSSVGPLKVSTISRRSRRRSAQPPRPAESPVEVVAVDLPKSLEYLELAAAQGDASAALRCGQCYLSGDGGAADIDADKAVSFLLQALKDEKVAPKAHFVLAQIFDTGLEGATSTGENEAAYLSHLLAALQGRDADALHMVASLHLQLALPEESGDGSLSEARRAFLLRDCGQRFPVQSHGHHHCSHEHGSCSHKEHQHQESVSDHRGEQAWSAGVDSAAMHLERAVDLLRAASAAGQAEATLTLGALVYRGLVRGGASGSDGEAAAVDPKRRAFELYELAAEQGSLEAWRNIASMHFLGEGVPRSEKTAREIMRVVFGKGS